MAVSLSRKQRPHLWSILNEGCDWTAVYLLCSFWGIKHTGLQAVDIKVAYNTGVRFLAKRVSVYFVFLDLSEQRSQSHIQYLRCQGLVVIGVFQRFDYEFPLGILD